MKKVIILCAAVLFSAMVVNAQSKAPATPTPKASSTQPAKPVVESSNMEMTPADEGNSNAEDGAGTLPKEGTSPRTPRGNVSSTPVTPKAASVKPSKGETMAKPQRGSATPSGTMMPAQASPTKPAKPTSETAPAAPSNAIPK